MNQSLKLLAFFPHPDDETFGVGPTLAKYAAEGIETHLVCATRGERGWPGPKEQYPGLEGLGRIREGELRCAAQQLGIREVSFLDYLDGEVDQADPAEAIAKLVGHIRRIRPQVVMTYGPDGVTGHPDHIALSQFTAAALVRAAETAYQDPAGQAPFTVSKFYYAEDSKAVVEGFRHFVGKRGTVTVVDGQEREHAGWDEWALAARIDTRDFVEATWQAILCHQSQLPGFGPLVDLPREAIAPLLSRGTFVRAYSLVNGGRRVEQDLFEGLR